VTRAWTVKQEDEAADQPSRSTRSRDATKEPRHAGALAGARTEERAFAQRRGPDPATMCSAGCGGFAGGFADTGEAINPLTR
jgi:hypothetical protein